uniref:Sinigrinase n=1 Tax=Brassica oleracea var. oleracea TaxID=109376 RepID=A0A0D3BKW7_BRAOL
MKGVLSLISIFLVLVLSGRCSDAYSRNDFPKGFSFGSATSAYQWEGAAGEDGKKPSVWDTFLHSRNLDNGDIACDGYHKYKSSGMIVPELIAFISCKESASKQTVFRFSRAPVFTASSKANPSATSADATWVERPLNSRTADPEWTTHPNPAAGPWGFHAPSDLIIIVPGVAGAEASPDATEGGPLS